MVMGKEGFITNAVDAAAPPTAAAVGAFSNTVSRKSSRVSDTVSIAESIMVCKLKSIYS
jgi:hypothetical protein